MSKKKIITVGIFLIILIGGILLMNMNKEDKRVMQDYPRPIDVVSIKPVITCNIEKEEEINISVQNYTTKDINGFDLEVISKDDNRKVTSLNFKDVINANESIDVRGRIPNGLSYEDVKINIINYELEK